MRWPRTPMVESAGLKTRSPRMKRRTVLAQLSASLAASPAILSYPVSAQAVTKIAYGYSAVTDFATVFIGADEGLFAKRGLEVEPKFIPLNPTIIPGIESGSLQMGGPTPSGYLQAVDGGLDHVVLGGGGGFSKAYTELGVVGRVGANIKTPADFIGKKVGIPGLGRATASHVPPMAQAQWCGRPPGGVHRGAVPAACRPDPWWLAGSCTTWSRFPGTAISSPASRTRWAAARSPAQALARPAR